MSEELCRCGRALFGDIEEDTGICGWCADRLYERHVAQKEWEHFHPPADDQTDSGPENSREEMSPVLNGTLDCQGEPVAPA